MQGKCNHASLPHKTSVLGRVKLTGLAIRFDSEMHVRCFFSLLSKHTTPIMVESVFMAAICLEGLTKDARTDIEPSLNPF